jgi:hypothetical protein
MVTPCIGCSLCAACAIAGIWCGSNYGALGGLGVVGLVAW